MTWWDNFINYLRVSTVVDTVVVVLIILAVLVYQSWEYNNKR